MWREIDILRKALRKNCALVDKASRVLWTEEDVEQAAAADRFQQVDSLLPPDEQMEVSGLYPGCMQLSSAMAHRHQYCAVGQTEHFVIFHPANDIPTNN